MRHSVYTKTLYDKRGFLAGWSLGFLFLTFLMVIFFPAMHQNGALDELIGKLPPAMQGLVGNLADLRQFSTYLASQLFDIRGSLIAGVLAIILGLGITVGEEDKGYLRTMLAMPVSRTKVFVHKWLAMATIMAIVTTVVIGAVYAFAPLVGETVKSTWVLELALMLWLVMLTFGSITFAVGMATGRRSAAMTTSILVVIGSFILTTFAVSVDWLKDLEVVSILHYFKAVDIVKYGLSFGDCMIFVSLSFALPLVALWFFRRRDIAA